MAQGDLTVSGADGGPRARLRRWLPWIVAEALSSVLLVAVLLASRGAREPASAPEAERVLQAQAGLPFQVLIPGYLPAGFDREAAEVKVTPAGAGGRPAVQISYYNRRVRGAIFVSEWMPISPTIETLFASQPIETKWGRGYLLTDQASGLSTVWADIGLVRAAVDSPQGELVPAEVALAILNSLGPAANQQVSSVIAEQPEIRAAAAPPPVQAELNDQGTQELTLVATAAGYAPARFSVRAGIPFRLTFRQLGDAACASELVFPADPARPSTLVLTSPQDQKSLQFTPAKEGEFVFHCEHGIYQGVMKVE